MVVFDVGLEDLLHLLGAHFAGLLQVLDVAVQQVSKGAAPRLKLDLALMGNSFRLGDCRLLSLELQVPRKAAGISHLDSDLKRFAAENVQGALVGAGLRFPGKGAEQQPAVAAGSAFAVVGQDCARSLALQQQ
ncbi:hypothetical protein D9M69_628090 [compost metagenome]